MLSMTNPKNGITDVPGIKVGHYTDREGATGCTVVLCEEGAVAGVDVRGSASGTREIDPLRPMSLVRQVNAVLLSGGSAFGLDAAGGVMRYLEERGFGFQTSVARVPIVPAAILFDLGIGSARARPGADEGYRACLAASDGEIAEGSVGAGTGAVVAKVLGMERAVKGGLGTASERFGQGIVVGAIVAVNAFGDVIDPGTGATLAAPRRPGGGFIRTLDLLKSGQKSRYHIPDNTTIGVVATNATLDKEQVNKIAQMAQDGVARAIEPAHTMVDGDVLFALATCKTAGIADVTLLGSVAAEVVARAIVRAITQAESLWGIPSVRDL